jgi:hypothetical protein
MMEHEFSIGIEMKIKGTHKEWTYLSLYSSYKLRSKMVVLGRWMR